MKCSLFDEMRCEQNLFAAWRHVKKSALNSPNKSIRGNASEFEFAHQRYLKTIGAQLRENRFAFDDVTGVLKDKKEREAVGKEPRPIALATIKNRIVQRAILQILQPRKALDKKDADTRYSSACDPRLGKINSVNRSRFGVGGLLKPYGGVEPAINTIRTAIDNGANHFYQSDIEAFFTKIPTKPVIDFIERETDDPKLAQIFDDALKVCLENEEELKSYATLFPHGGIGVAQGSSLSAFAGNVLLYDLDHKLNKSNVVAVRYIDDLLMVSDSESDLNSAVNVAKRELKQFGFSLYPPSADSEKASSGLCINSINFLGCTIQPNKCVPSARSTRKIKNDINDLLKRSKDTIYATVKSDKPFQKEMAQSAVIDKIGKKMFGWQRSFKFCTDSSPFRKVDKDVTKSIEDYIGFVHRITSRTDSVKKMKVLGIPNMLELFDLTQQIK